MGTNAMRGGKFRVSLGRHGGMNSLCCRMNIGTAFVGGRLARMGKDHSR